jgi:hypothetical protein
MEPPHTVRTMLRFNKLNNVYYRAMLVIGLSPRGSRIQ